MAAQQPSFHNPNQSYSAGYGPTKQEDPPPYGYYPSAGAPLGSQQQQQQQQPGFPVHQPAYFQPNAPYSTAGAYPPAAPQPFYIPAGAGAPNPGYGNPAYPNTIIINGGPPIEQPNPTEMDAEQGRPSNFNSSFSDVNVRRSFVRKVYVILMLQLLVTFGFICLFVFNDGVKRFVKENIWFYYLSYAVFIVTYISLVCCSGLRRRFPANLILLTVFTLAMSYMTATISSFYDTKIVLMAIGICVIVCLIVSVSSAFCSFDVTRWGWVLGIAAFILMLFGIVTLMFAFIPGLYTPWYHGFYSGLIALVFIGFLAYDTQMILGGRRYAISPEEHIYGALQLYLDVVYIFLGVLGIGGAGSSN